MSCPAQPESEGLGVSGQRKGPLASIPWRNHSPSSMSIQTGSSAQETQSLWSPWLEWGAQEGSGRCLLKGGTTTEPGAVGPLRPEATLPLLFVGLEAAARGGFFLATAAHCSSAHGSQEKQAAARLGNLPCCSDAPAPSRCGPLGQGTGTPGR